MVVYGCQVNVVSQIALYEGDGLGTYSNIVGGSWREGRREGGRGDVRCSHERLPSPDAVSSDEVIVTVTGLPSTVFDWMVMPTSCVDPSEMVYTVSSNPIVVASKNEKTNLI